MKAGHSLPELLVSMGLLCLLLLLTFTLYRMGSSALYKNLAEVDLVQQGLILSKRLSQEILHSHHQSLSLDPTPPASATAVSFLSCWDPVNQGLDLDPLTLAPRWRQYLVFYHQSSDSTIILKEIPLAPPSSSAPPLIPLTPQRTGGRILIRQVSRCEFRQADRRLDVTLVLEKNRYGKSQPERLSLVNSYLFRL